MIFGFLSEVLICLFYFSLVLQLKQSHSLDSLPSLTKSFMTFSFCSGYQIHLPSSPPFFSLGWQISTSVFHFCPYPWCIKFRDSSTHFQLIFLLPFSTSWKPSLMHYPGVSRKPLCYPLFQELLWLSCQRGSCCCHQRISLLPPISWPQCFSQDFSFFSPCKFWRIQNDESRTDNMFSRWPECTWYCNSRWCWWDGNFSSPFWWPVVLGLVGRGNVSLSHSVSALQLELLPWALDTSAIPGKVIAWGLQNIRNVCPLPITHSFTAHPKLLSRI